MNRPQLIDAMPAPQASRALQERIKEVRNNDELSLFAQNTVIEWMYCAEIARSVGNINDEMIYEDMIAAYLERESIRGA